MTAPVARCESPRSQHFRVRQFERQFRPEVLEFILAFGTETRACGATHLTIVRSELPRALRDGALARRASGWVVLLGDDGWLMTCYRREDAVRYLRRKPKRRVPERRVKPG